MDDRLFGRSRSEPDDAGLPANVDRVFSEAVERQVAEQRALNRLLENATERLDALEAGVRSLRETGSTQGVALRAELQESLARLTEDVHRRFRDLTQEIEELARATTEHADRLVHVVQSSESLFALLDQRSDQLADVLTRRLEEVAEQPASAGPVQLLFSGLREEIDDRFESLRRQLVALDDRLAEQGAVLSHAATARSEQLLSELRTSIERQGAGLERQDEDLRRQNETLQRLAEEFDQQYARLEGTRTELQQHHGEVVAGLRATLDELAGRAREDLERLLREQLGGPLREDLAQRLSARLAEEVVGLQATMAARITALQEQLEDDARTRVQGLATRLEAISERVNDLAAELVRHVDRLDAAAVDRDRAARESIQAVASDSSATSAAIEGRLHVIEGHLDGHTRAIGSLAAAVEATDASVHALTDEGPGRAATETIGQLRPLLQEFAGRIEAEQKRELSGVVDHVRGVSTTLTNELDELQLAMTALRRSLSETEEREQALRAELLARVGERLSGGLAGVQATVHGGLDETRSVVESRLTSAAERLAELESTVEQRLEQLQSVVQDRLIAAAEDDAALRSELRERLTEGIEQLTGRTEAVADVVSTGMEAVGGRVDERLAAVHAALSDGLPRALADHREELAASLVEAIDTAGSRLFEAAEGVREQLAAAADESRAQLAAVADEARQQLFGAEERLGAATAELGDLEPIIDARATEAIDRAATVALEQAERTTAEVRAAAEDLARLADHFERLEGSLVSYLEARDARLEHERSSVLADLIEEFAAGLTRRERRKLSGRLEDVRQNVVPPPPPPPPLRSTAPPGGDEPPGLLARLLGEDGSDAEGDVGAADDVFEDEVPIPEAPAEPAEPMTLRKAPARPPVAPAPDDGEPDAHEVLASIKGLGPSKQQALLDHFGSLDAVRTASIDELLEVRGIGEATAAEIHDRLRRSGKRRTRR